MSFKLDQYLWLGTEESLETAITAVSYGLENSDRASDFMKNRAFEVALSNDFFDDEEDYEPFYEILQEGPDGTVIMNITGPLVAEDSWFNMLFGMVSYESIIKASHFLMEDGSVEQVVLNFDTPGGTVAGIDGAGEALKALAQKKPLLAHVNGSAFSAGYWLASSADSINASKMSEVGSIGVIMTVTTLQKLYEERGIDVTVITAGKHKGLGHPAKKLTDEDKAILQQKADTLYGFFLEKVSSDRPSLSIASKEVWAEGKTFFAEEGLAVNLVDSVMSTEAFFAVLKDKKSRGRSTSSHSTQYSQGNDMPKSVLLKSETDKAALASGADLSSFEITEEEQQEDTTAEAENQNMESEASGQTSKEGEGQETPAGGDGNEQQDPAVTAGMDSLLNKISDLTEQNAVLKAEKKVAEGKLEKLETSLKDLTDIAIEATHKMQIALKQEPIALEDMPVSTVVAQHQKTKATFESRFKIGQQTRASESSDDDDVTTGQRLGIVPKT